MPKVAASGYTKFRLLTVIRKQLYRHGWLSASTALLLVSRVRGSMTVCLVSLAMVESTADVAAVRLLSCSSVSGYASAVSVLATVSHIVDQASNPATYPAAVAAANYPCRLSSQLSLRLFFRLLSTVTFPTTCSSLQFSSIYICIAHPLMSLMRYRYRRTKCRYLQNKNVLTWCLKTSNERFDLFDSCARYKFSSFIHSFILTTLNNPVRHSSRLDQRH